MPALVDDRLEKPCTHAFVVGVSRYRHLDDGTHPTALGTQSELAQLTSAAHSASEVAAWLLEEYENPDAPLASLRVCLAPSTGEQLNPSVTSKLPSQVNASRDTVMKDWLEFKDRCRERRDAVAIVYVAGHGVQLSSQGATLLLEDFAGNGQENALWAALDMRGLHLSLSDDEAAARQFWFIDTCREPPAIAKRFETMQGAYSGDEGRGRSDHGRANPGGRDHGRSYHTGAARQEATPEKMHPK